MKIAVILVLCLSPLIGLVAGVGISWVVFPMREIAEDASYFEVQEIVKSDLADAEQRAQYATIGTIAGVGMGVLIAIVIPVVFRRKYKTDSSGNGTHALNATT